MRVTAVDTPAQQLAVDAVAVPVAGSAPPEGAALELDRQLDGLISEVLASAEHRRRPNEVMALPSGFSSTITRIDGPSGPLVEAYPPMSVAVSLADDL